MCRNLLGRVGERVLSRGNSMWKFLEVGENWYFENWNKVLVDGIL